MSAIDDNQIIMVKELADNVGRYKYQNDFSSFT